MVGRCRAVLAAFALCACTTHEITDAGPTPDPDATTETSSPCAFCIDATYDVPAPTPLPPPEVACVLDAGDGGVECPLLGSFCLNANTLEYFDNGVCVDGGCQFDALLHPCVCQDGGCVLIPPGTMVPPPPHGP